MGMSAEQMQSMLQGEPTSYEKLLRDVSAATKLRPSVSSGLPWSVYKSRAYDEGVRRAVQNYASMIGGGAGLFLDKGEAEKATEAYKPVVAPVMNFLRWGGADPYAPRAFRLQRGLQYATPDLPEQFFNDMSSGMWRRYQNPKGYMNEEASSFNPNDRALIFQYLMREKMLPEFHPGASSTEIRKGVLKLDKFFGAVAAAAETTGGTNVVNALEAVQKILGDPGLYQPEDWEPLVRRQIRLSNMARIS